jgi:error-prone DNA polymerase
LDPVFAELCAKSCFSFLEGASQPGDLVAAAKELGLHSIAIADRDGLYGSARAHAASKESGQRVIVGAELTIEPVGRGSVALLAIDHEGYSNLCAMLTAAHADHDKGEAGLLIDRVAASPRGLFAIVPVDARGRAPHDALFGPIRDAYGDRALTATWIHRDGFDKDRIAAARSAEARFGMRAIATTRPLYHEASKKPLADIVHCIRHKTTLDEAGSALSPNAEARLRSPREMLSLFRHAPELVRRTVEIADECRFSLAEIKYHFPSETMCNPGEPPDDALRRLVGEGCARRYPEGTPPDVRSRIDKELRVIARMGVAPYFLSVHQIVEIARARKILCQGRGSAANSAVCFVLGITAVDPARVDLLFERFLSVERHEPPDIDVDFEHERREEVIQEIYAMHGRDRAAMVSEVISYRGRSALREVGKVFGLSIDQVDRLSGLVIHMDPAGMSEERLREAGLDPEDPRLQQALAWAGELEGYPRHLSIHVGGFVISSRPIHEVAPIEPARMEGRTVIPWDKDDIDELGFFKIDVLGLGMLTAIRKSLALLHDGPAEGFDPIEALARIPPEDPRVYAAIQRADVIGVFQIESRAQMSMLPRLKPKEFYDLVVEVAIVRPGPIQGGMVHPYLRRRMGKERPDPPHPCLAPILTRTLGVPLFQEQVMQIAMVGAGYEPGEADQLRRDMAAWKRTGRLARHRDKLLAGFKARGISQEFGEKLYQQIHGFGEYGFPESHAASFALLVYASAWIKTHHPSEFACALLNAQPMGFYSPSSIVKDAQRHRVEVRPPCVVASAWDSTLEPPPARGRPPALRLGLRQIRGLSTGAGEAIARARREQALSTLPDLVRRARLDKRDVEALAEAGALVALVPARREALWQARAPREGGLFDGIDLEDDEEVGLPELRPLEQLALDYGRVGLSIHDHPLAHLRDALAKRGVKRAQDLSRLRHGTRVTVAGLVIGRQRPGTASGVTFFTLEDETGMVNLIVHATLFAENYVVARHAKLLLVRGRVERQGAVIHVLAETLSRLTLPDGDERQIEHEMRMKSRDFH